MSLKNSKSALSIYSSVWHILGERRRGNNLSGLNSWPSPISILDNSANVSSRDLPAAMACFLS